MTIELLVRGRFVPMPTATSTRLAGNTWAITVPDPASIQRQTRRGSAPEEWDGAVFCLDGQESEPGVASGGDAEHVVVTVWVV